MKPWYYFVFILILSCSDTKKVVKVTTKIPNNVSLNGKLFTALFQQRAAEYRALCLQGYNIARLSINNYTPKTNFPKAIITDIDETILDNSPYAVQQAYNGKEYDAPSWYNWTSKASADTMPGAASFLAFVASKNVEVFYVTNRLDNETTSTLKNLQNFNLPNADEAHFFPKTNTSSKEARRNKILQTHEVILLMGDNLADLHILFDKKTEQERKTNVDVLSAEFGSRYIVFPNANYGDWESSLYKYNYTLTQAQKDSIIKLNLRIK